MSGSAQDQRPQKDTPWRQGHLLPVESHASLGLTRGDRYIVISHDCDLASEEEQVEVIRGQFVDTADGTLRYGENPRKLHLLGRHTQSQSDIFLALQQSDKLNISKHALNQLAPADDWEIPKVSRALLQHWLACRYQRHALPNALNDRLAKALDKLRTAAKSRPDCILGVFIGFDPDDELEDTEPYELEFAVVYRSHAQGGLDKANELVTRLWAAVSAVEGVDCPREKVKPYSDLEFTLFDMTRLVRFRLEFLSFRGSAPGDIIPN